VFPQVIVRRTLPGTFACILPALVASSLAMIATRSVPPFGSMYAELIGLGITSTTAGFEFRIASKAAALNGVGKLNCESGVIFEVGKVVGEVPINLPVFGSLTLSVISCSTTRSRCQAVISDL